MSLERTKRSPYSKEQLHDMYGLAKMLLETGHFRRADNVVSGLVSVAPDFSHGWLASAVVGIALGRIERARDHAQQALRVRGDMAEAMLVLVVSSLTLGDYATAGTFLGELRDLIEAGVVSDPNTIRLFRMQMVRYNQEFDA